MGVVRRRPNYDPTSPYAIKEQTLVSSVVPPKGSYAVGFLNESTLLTRVPCGVLVYLSSFLGEQECS